MRLSLRRAVGVAALALAAGVRPGVALAQAAGGPKPPPGPTAENQVTPEEAVRLDSIRAASGGVLPPPPPEASPIPVATAPAVARPVPEATLQEFRDDPAHRYGRGHQEVPSWLQRFLMWLGERIDDLFFASSSGMAFWRNAALALGLLLLAWALYRLFGGEGSGFFGRRDKKAAPEVGPLLDVEDIAGVDLDRLLADARREGRDRDVVRYRFLRALQALAAAGAVVWRKDRTNRDYLLALRASAPGAAEAFAAAAHVFSWVWYGDNRLDREAAVAAGERMDRLDAAVGALVVVAPERTPRAVADEVYE